MACAAPATALTGTTVSDLPQGRRPGPAVVHPGDTLHRAAVVLSLAGVDALVVSGDRGRLVGLVTASDLVAAFAGRQPARWMIVPEGRQEEPHLLLPGRPPHRPERRTGVP
ncbi:CBS domain-containing protein [Kitasatospora sp. NPDC048343]|uniref:CBS domain-containing protein n=1 Tax=Kitasatospora sp. NPDC048343 TaxID=3154717 RepID=UPI0033ED1B39